jgi:hypothetical protein
MIICNVTCQVNEILFIFKDGTNKQDFFLVAQKK